jgi:hypothetical protein
MSISRPPFPSGNDGAILMANEEVRVGLHFELVVGSRPDAWPRRNTSCRIRGCLRPNR